MSALDRCSPEALVFGGIVSVQFGAALATSLIPRIGAGGSVLLRLGVAALALTVVLRPRVRGYGTRAWMTVVAFGLSTGLMNFFFYSSLARIPLGVAVTLEFLGPLVVAAGASRRPRDMVAVAGAGLGVALISHVIGGAQGYDQLDRVGVLLGLVTAVFWGGYIVFSARTGALFPRLDGLAIALCVGTVVVLPLGAGAIASWTWDTVLRGAGIAVLSSLVPYSLELVALRRMRRTTFGILMSLEPAVAALAGFLLLGQRLSGPQLFGMALVVFASVAVLGAPGASDDDTAEGLTGAD